MGSRVLREASAFNNKLIFTAMAVFALLLQPVYAVVVGQTANAAAGVVTNANPDGWYWGGAAWPAGASGSAVITANSTTGGNAALKLATPASASYIWAIQEGLSQPLAGITSISYMSQREAGSTYAAPALLLQIDRDGDTSTNDTFYAFYEPYYSNPAADYNSWNTWNIDRTTAKFWSSSTVGTLGGANGANMFTLDYVQSVHPGAAVTAYRLNQGTGNTAWITWVDRIAVNGVTIADFELEEVVTNINTGVVYEDLQSAVDAASAGDELRLERDITLSDDVDITKPLTLDGNGKTITAGFSKTDNSNNSLISVLSDVVIIKNLKLDGVNHENQLHGINAYQVQSLFIDGVEVRNFLTGILYNGSTGTVQNVVTANNAWHGINIDKVGANVNVLGTNTHTEDFNIYVDDDTLEGLYVYAPAYEWRRSGIEGRDNDRVYRLIVDEDEEEEEELPAGGLGGESVQTTTTTTTVEETVVVTTMMPATTEVAEVADTAVDSTSEEAEIAGDQDDEKTWSLVNVLLAVATTILSVVAVLGLRKNDEDSKLIRLLTILPAIAAIGVVLWVEDFSAKLGWFNAWTFLLAVIVAAQAVLFVNSNAADEE